MRLRKKERKDIHVFWVLPIYPLVLLFCVLVILLILIPSIDMVGREISTQYFASQPSIP